MMQEAIQETEQAKNKQEEHGRFFSPFKQWPKSYEWIATINLQDETAPTLSSHWRRI